jgi:hypothetical protein
VRIDRRVFVDVVLSRILGQNTGIVSSGADSGDLPLGDGYDWEDGDDPVPTSLIHLEVRQPAVNPNWPVVYSRARRVVPEPIFSASFASAILNDKMTLRSPGLEVGNGWARSTPSSSVPPTEPRKQSCRSSMELKRSTTSGPCGLCFQASWAKLELPRYLASKP